MNFGDLTFRKEILVQDLVFNSAWAIDNYGEVVNDPHSVINIRGQLGGLSNIVNQLTGTFHNHGAIHIEDTQARAFHNIGSFFNYNDIYINNISQHAIVNGGVWNNKPGGSIDVNDATAPVDPTIFNSGGVFNNDGDIRLTNMQSIGLRNDGVFNNNNLLQIDSTRTSSAIRNLGTLNNNHHISLSNVNYSNGAMPFALMNDESSIIVNNSSITLAYNNGHGIHNKGTINSTSAIAKINMYYTDGDLYVNDIGAVFEIRELHLSSIF